MSNNMDRPIPQSLPNKEQETWHSIPSAEVAGQFQTAESAGLTGEEASLRLKESGPNRLTEEESEPFWKEFLEELREPMVLLLLFTGGLYAIWGELSEAITVFAVILLHIFVYPQSGDLESRSVEDATARQGWLD